MISFQPASVQQLASSVAFCKYSMYLAVHKDKYIHIHRVVLFVILEGAVLAQSPHSQSCTLKDSPLSSSRGTGMMNFFFFLRGQTVTDGPERGLAKGETWVWEPENTKSGLAIYSVTMYF